MPEFNNSSQISQDNLSIRERGVSSAREYSRIVEIFDRVLQYKEKFRMSIEGQLASIGKQVKENIENFIYDLLNKSLKDFKPIEIKLANDEDGVTLLLYLSKLSEEDNLFFGQFIDITDYKNLEQKFAHSQKSLAMI